MHPPHLLLLGYGDLNSQVAHRLAGQFNITAVSRSSKTLNNGQHIALDLVQDSLTALPAAPDIILYCLTPGKLDEDSYRQVFQVALKRVTDFYQGHPPRHFIFVSSTSVYAQNDGEWVDESSPTLPSSHTGRVLIEAEQHLREQPYPTTSVRFSGIYGGHRTRLLEQIRSGLKSDQGPCSYTNRIHVIDAVRVLIHLVTMGAKGKRLSPCYLASDSCPVPMHEVVGWVRQEFCLQKLDCQPIQLEKHNQSPGRGGSKRCNNQRLIATGFDFEYPDFKLGYREMIQEIKLGIPHL